MITIWRHCTCWHSFYVLKVWTWIIYLSNVLSIKTILFDILDFWYQLVVIRFVKTLSKRRMFVSFMNISACWLLHRLIKFNKICWEKRPAKPRPNLRTSFCRRDLKNTQPHLKGGTEPLEKEIHEILGSKREDRFLDPFFDWVQHTSLVRFSYLLRLCNF